MVDPKATNSDPQTGKTAKGSALDLAEHLEALPLASQVGIRKKPISD